MFRDALFPFHPIVLLHGWIAEVKVGRFSTISLLGFYVGGLGRGVASSRPFLSMDNGRGDHVLVAIGFFSFLPRLLSSYDWHRSDSTSLRLVGEGATGFLPLRMNGPSYLLRFEPWPRLHLRFGVSSFCFGGTRHSVLLFGGGKGLDRVRVSLSHRTHTRCICSEWGVEPRSKGGKEPHLPPSLRGWPLPVRRGCVCLVGCGDGGAQGGEDAHAPLFTRWATSRPTFGSNRVCRRHHGAHRQPDLRTALLQERDAHPHGGTRRSW